MLELHLLDHSAGNIVDDSGDSVGGFDEFVGRGEGSFVSVSLWNLKKASSKIQHTWFVIPLSSNDTNSEETELLGAPSRVIIKGMSKLDFLRVRSPSVCKVLRNQRKFCTLSEAAAIIEDCGENIFGKTIEHFDDLWS